MDRIKVKFVDMPSEFDIHNNFILDILRKRYIVEESDCPDFLFYSVFDVKNFIYKNCVKIFICGEPILPNFNDCDYAIGYVRINFSDRYFRAADVLASGIGLEIPDSIQNREDVAEDMFDRRFCNFVYKNTSHGEGARLRTAFCKQLMEYRRVDCPGVALHNCDGELAPRYTQKKDGSLFVPDNSWQDAKLSFIRKYKFTIAFENTKLPGMTTEKLLNPFQAYSIPIYWGNPDAAKDFNPKAFINCHDYSSFDEVIDKIRELDADKKLYIDMLRQPPMREDYPFHQRDALEQYIYHIIEKGNQPVRNPESSENWETISANLVYRWGGTYEKVKDYFDSCENGILNATPKIYPTSKELEREWSAGKVSSQFINNCENGHVGFQMILKAFKGWLGYKLHGHK